MSGDVVSLGRTVHRRSGRPVVFIHGFGHNQHVWAALVERLDPALRPITLDLRGHGDADWSLDGRYGVDDYARDLPAALDALGLQSAVIVAHSLGGHAATLLAARLPARVEGLVLVDTGPGLSTVALSRIAADTGSTLGRFEDAAAYQRWLTLLHPLCDARTLETFARRSVVRRLDGDCELRLDPGVMEPDIDAGEWRAVERKLEQALSGIRCPALLVRGGLSSVLPVAAAERIALKLLPDGRLHTLEQAGHAAMLDDPDGLRACIERFVARDCMRDNASRVAAAAAPRPAA
jgi:esterase